MSASTAGDASFAFGELVGNTYAIRGVLGSGGMGTVYEAHDRLLNRSVAIKVAHADMSSFPIWKEAQALAAMRHPAIVSVYGVGTHRGIEYMVMERIRGETLEDRLRAQQQRPSLAEALDLLIRIAGGLAVIHAAGISHRDIKPGNIILGPANRVVLMDFGLFCPEFTVAPVIVGTAEYLAPELIEQRSAPGMGHLADVYAVGVLAYLLITGELPFHGNHPGDILSQHLTEPVPQLPLERVGAPRELVALVGELLAKNPRQRVQSIEMVEWQLRAIRTHIAAGRLDGHFSVLIVEDDSAMVETLEWVVKDAAPDARLRVARDGETALAAVRQKPPHLILLDVGLPRMNGVELCMCLQGEGLTDRCHIVSLSGMARPRDVQLLQTLGVRGFIPKGLDLARSVGGLISELRHSYESG